MKYRLDRRYAINGAQIGMLLSCPEDAQEILETVIGGGELRDATPKEDCNGCDNRDYCHSKGHMPMCWVKVNITGEPLKEQPEVTTAVKEAELTYCPNCYSTGFLCTHNDKNPNLPEECPTGLDDCIECDWCKECPTCKGLGLVPAGSVTLKEEEQP